MTNNCFSLTGIHGRPSEVYIQRSHTFGAVLDIRRIVNVPSEPEAVLLKNLDSAFRVSQLKTFFSDYGDPVGYVAWALLTVGVETRLIKTRSTTLDSIEWNEGTSLWIMDMAAIQGAGRRLIDYCYESLQPSSPTLTYFRRVKGELRIRRILRG